MSQFPVRLQKFLADANGGLSGTIEYLTALPFVPMSGLKLGLYPDSDWYMDCETVERVMWLAVTREFLVRLADARFERLTPSVFATYFSEGWRVALDIRCDSREEACSQLAEDSGTDWRAVGIRGGWYQVREDDMQLLRLSGESFELIEPPYTRATP